VITIRLPFQWSRASPIHGWSSPFFNLACRISFVLAISDLNTPLVSARPANFQTNLPIEAQPCYFQNAMTRLRPVIWAKGTFLTSQHLQAQDRFIESTLRFNLNALRFRPWGFRELAIDRQLLATGVFSITSASGIFPDGLLFHVPGSDPAPAVKGLAGCFDRGQTSVDVYLAIPNYLDRGLNVSSQKNAGTRFIAEIAKVRDEVADSSDKPIQIARKNFSLLTAEENHEGKSLLCVARVERIRGMFHLDPNFIPPLLDVSASDRLISITHGLVEMLGAKSTSLAAMRRQRNPRMAHFTLAEGPQFWLLYTVNTYFPMLKHIFESKTGHPEALFSVMNLLAGALTTFSRTVHPRELPLYDHNDLTGSFAKMDDLIRELLKNAVSENFLSLPLKPFSRQFIYSTSLSEDRFFKNASVYLAVAAEMNKAELIGKVPDLIRVWSANEIDERVNQALQGIPLSHVENAPASIPVKANFEYFSLDLNSGKGWEGVKRARNLAAHVPRDFPNPRLELIIVLPDSSDGG
jgi:type VI secretion system protein ImpJ